MPGAVVARIDGVARLVAHDLLRQRARCGVVGDVGEPSISTSSIAYAATFNGAPIVLVSSDNVPSVWAVTMI